MFSIEEIVSAKFKFADGTESDVSHWYKDGTCGKCSSSAMVYHGQSMENSKYTYCSLELDGSGGWKKVHKNSRPKWCPRIQERIDI